MRTHPEEDDVKQDTRDYWSFVEKIQDATDYVQELLTENNSLRRRMANLEREKLDLAERLGTLRQQLHREHNEDPLLRYQLGRDDAAVAGRIAPPLPAACPQPARSRRPALQAV